MLEEWRRKHRQPRCCVHGNCDPILVRGALVWKAAALMAVAEFIVGSEGAQEAIVVGEGVRDAS